MSFPVHRFAQVEKRGPGVVVAKADQGPGRIVTFSGHGVGGRVQGVFAAAAISTTEEETRDAARSILVECPGGNLSCVLRATGRLIWSLATYDPDEGSTMRRGSDFDVYRSFRRLRTTGKFDCDCASAAASGIWTLMGLDAFVRVIEQYDRHDGTWSWNHIWPRVGLQSLGRHQNLMGLELTPVPPDNHRAAPGWETAPTTYRRALDFKYEPATWRAWLKACDLERGILAPFPSVRSTPHSCTNCGQCDGKCSAR